MTSRLLLAALSTLALPALAQAPAAPASTGSASPRTRILYIGLDGATTDLMRTLIASGDLPNIAALVEHGTFTPLHSHEPTRSPAVWTTLATGTRKERHGIYDYVTSTWYWPEALRTKEKLLATSDMRKDPALWTFLTEQKKTSVVVGWLSTWPAEAIQGAVVAPYIDIGNDRQTTIKGAIYKTGADRQTHDPKLFAQLRRKLKTPGQFGSKYLKKYFDQVPPGHPLFAQLRVFKRYAYTVSWTGARMHNNTQSALYLAKKFDPELVMVYYQCPDSLGHRFWLFRQSEEAIAARLEAVGVDPALAADLKRRYGDTIDACYREIDRHLGLLQAGLGEGWSTVIVSDHGFGDCEQRCENKNVPFNGGHRNDGILLVSGPAFAKGGTIEDPWVEDLTPTILTALGLPVPEGLDGKVLTGALERGGAGK